MVSLAERSGYLQALRAGIAVVVLASAVVADYVVGASVATLILVTAFYLSLNAVSEGLRRAAGGRALVILTATLLVDGLYLAWVAHVTGAADSPLKFLAYLHIIGVTLLASYRTGLKIAVWHSLLYFVVFYAQAAGLLATTMTSGATNTSAFQRGALFNVGALLLVAVATAAFSALNERELRKRKGDVEALSSMASELETQSEPGAIAQTVLERLCDAFGFNRGVVLAAPQGGRPSLLAYHGPGDPAHVSDGVDALERSVSKGKHAVLMRHLDTSANRRIASLLPMARNLIAVPLSAEGHPLGTIVLEHPGGGGERIERRVVAMVEQFAAHAGLALSNAWLLEQIQKMAETDSLTGIANRRVFERMLEKELARAKRHGDHVTLALLDIDSFKAINDTYGHQVGDQILKEVARNLQAGCRLFDTPARYGGEEFAVILPSCGWRESLAVGERLRKHISPIESLAPMTTITASAGVATFPVQATDAEGLIRAADEALYESKRTGRDRVTRSRRRATIPARHRPEKAPEPTPAKTH